MNFAIYLKHYSTTGTCQDNKFHLDTESCLPSVFKAINLQRPGTGLRGTYLHHDNASSHTYQMTIQFIEESGPHILPHPPYSPDLAHVTSGYFLELRNTLKVEISSVTLKLRRPEKYISDIEENEFKDAIQACFKRMNKCIHAKGCYFEQV